MSGYSFVSINGQPISDESCTTVSIWDTSFHRGDGVFETMRLLPSHCADTIRGLDEHITRLEASARIVACPLPPTRTIRDWLVQASNHAVKSPLNVGDGAPGSLKLIATKGNSGKGIDPSVIIMWTPLPSWSASYTLYPLLAPWHCAGMPGWETAIKWTSCGPNVVSTQKAKAAGFTDALLLSSLRLEQKIIHITEDEDNARHRYDVLADCHVMDGPSFAVSWVKEGALYVPDAEILGLLQSVTQALVQKLCKTKLSMPVNSGIYTLRDILSADEAFVLSTTRGVIPITRIGEHDFSETRPITERLQHLFAEAYGVYQK